MRFDISASAIQNAGEKYALGNSAHEQERLKVQAKFLERWSEQYLLSAGLEPGMRVLDLGCGLGDVSLLVAKLVGTSGHVTGIDRDPVIVTKARERARNEGCDEQVEFIHTDLFDFQADHSFDAVVGRYVLMYQPDPVAAIRHAAEQVRSEGIIVFHEMDLANHIRSCPDETLFQEICALLAEIFRRSGYWPDLGLHLTSLFLDAGLPRPAIRTEVPVGGEPGSFIYRWYTETLRSMLPRIEEFGLGSSIDLEIDTLTARMEAEASIRQAQIVGPLQFGAWARKAKSKRQHQVASTLAQAVMV